MLVGLPTLTSSKLFLHSATYPELLPSFTPYQMHLLRKELYFPHTKAANAAFKSFLLSCIHVSYRYDLFPVSHTISCIYALVPPFIGRQ